MIAQSVFDFKIEATDKQLTAHAGLALLGAYMHGLGVGALVERSMPQPGSGRGRSPKSYVEALVLMLHGGGRVLEDLRILAADEALQEVLGGGGVPSPDATGDWLRRMGTNGGLAGLGAVRDEMNARMMRRDATREYTLDADATAIEAWKRDAAMTYKEFRGYMPMLGFLAENGLCIYEEFREGNVSPNTAQCEFYQRCVRHMPAGRRIARYRADAAHYGAELINQLEADGVSWAIAAPMDVAVRASVTAVAASDWRRGPKDDGCEYAWCAHAMEKSQQGFMLAIKRELIRQPELWDEKGMFRYHVVATNMNACRYTAWEVHAWYNRRGQAENLIKEVKHGFGMEYMPCGESTANPVWLRLGGIAYNLFVGFKRLCCPREWRRHTVATFRWRLYQVAGQVTRHARRMVLRLRAAADTLRTFIAIQAQIAQLRASPT